MASVGWDKKLVVTIVSVALSTIGLVAVLSLFAFQTQSDANAHEGEFKAHVMERSALDKKQDLIDKLQLLMNAKNDKKFERHMQIMQNTRENMVILMTKEGLRRKVVPLPEHGVE